MASSKLLIQQGFIKVNKRGNYRYDEVKKEYEPREGYELQEEDAYEEEIEVIPEQYAKTGFPFPLKRYNLSWEIFDLSLEEPYFWILDQLKGEFPQVLKLEDSFAAAENSAFFGVTQQRLGAQQDKISQYLATTGKMIKELFQMVRELRILDERLGYYGEVAEEVKKPLPERKKGAEITLKGFFVDLVQGGGKNPASIYGMARELEFITLPDLFFDAPPFKNAEELEEYVQSLAENFNQNVIRVLIRHLRQYLEWRVRTHKEHLDRRRFMLQYLLQHYEIIRMYLNWLKPYLRHVIHLTMKEKNLASADLVSAFEGSRLDVEVLATKKAKKGKGHECILATFNYRTRPEMKVVQEGYQRGPVHIGRFEFFLRVYYWTAKEIENYQRLKEAEILELMGDVSKSVGEAMESLGEELKRYIEEAKGEKEKKEGVPKEEKKTLVEKLFGDFLPERRAPAPKVAKGKEADLEYFEDEERENKDTVFPIRLICWNIFKNFKKAHRMIAW